MKEWIDWMIIVASLPLGLVVIYAVVRISSAAYFKSKNQFTTKEPS